MGAELSLLVSLRALATIRNSTESKLACWLSTATQGELDSTYATLMEVGFGEVIEGTWQLWIDSLNKDSVVGYEHSCVNPHVVDNCAGHKCGQIAMTMVRKWRQARYVYWKERRKQKEQHSSIATEPTTMLKLRIFIRVASQEQLDVTYTTLVRAGFKTGIDLAWSSTFLNHLHPRNQLHPRSSEEDMEILNTLSLRLKDITQWLTAGGVELRSLPWDQLAYDNRLTEFRDQRPIEFESPPPFSDSIWFHSDPTQQMIRWETPVRVLVRRWPEWVERSNMRIGDGKWPGQGWNVTAIHTERRESNKMAKHLEKVIECSVQCQSRVAMFIREFQDCIVSFAETVRKHMLVDHKSQPPFIRGLQRDMIDLSVVAHIACDRLLTSVRALDDLIEGLEQRLDFLYSKWGTWWAGPEEYLKFSYKCELEAARALQDGENFSCDTLKTLIEWLEIGFEVGPRWTRQIRASRHCFSNTTTNPI